MEANLDFSLNMLPSSFRLHWVFVLLLEALGFWVFLWGPFP
jgi:hypothetical protein